MPDLQTAASQIIILNVDLDAMLEKTERLDRYLAVQLAPMSRSRIQKLIEQGQVQVNDCPCTEKKTSIASGDRLSIAIPDIVPLDLTPQAIAFDILYEDEHLLIINKPAGLVVHPAPGHAEGTLVHGLLAHCPTLSGINGVQRPGIVHRLDKDTSGALAIAKTDRAHQHLQQQIQAKTARREYLGIVAGTPKFSQGVIDSPIGRHPVDRKRMAVVPHGRPAVTHWEIQERLRQYSLLRFELETGRTHQIRVHAAHMGHPIAGDPVYGKPLKSIPGQALHAWRLTLQHPIAGEPLQAIAPLPEAFLKLLAKLRG